MRLWPVLLVVACAKPQPSAPITAPPERPLTDVQLQCRSKESLNIGRLNADYGPTCNRPTMPLALNLFDLGSFDGEHAAIEYRHVAAILCMCGTDACDDATRSRAIDDAAHLVENRERDANKTISDTMGRHTSHSCLDGTIAVELYKTGSACGYLVGLDSATLRTRMEESFLKVFAEDPAKARRLAQDCWAGQPDAK